MTEQVLPCGDKMTELILFLFSVIGLSHIVIDSKIFAPVRDWFAEPKVVDWMKYPWMIPWYLVRWIKNNLLSKINEAIRCYLCFSVWAGWFLGLFLFDTWGKIFAGGFAASFLSNFAAMLMNYIEARTIVSLEDNQNEKTD